MSDDILEYRGWQNFTTAISQSIVHWKRWRWAERKYDVAVSLFTSSIRAVTSVRLCSLFSHMAKSSTLFIVSEWLWNCYSRRLYLSKRSWNLKGLRKCLKTHTQSVFWVFWLLSNWNRHTKNRSNNQKRKNPYDTRTSTDAAWSLQTPLITIQ